jgi:fatty acid desaturase
VVRAVSDAGFEALRREVERAGCFTPRPLRAVASFALHVAVSAALFAASARASGVGADGLFVAASLLFYRIGWLMHDAAHGGVFRRPAWDRAFAALTAGALGEFPSGWRYGHNRHHAAPNVRGRDLDQSERWDPARRYRTRAGAFVGVLLLSRFRGRYLPKTLLLLGLRDGYYCFTHHRRRFAAELVGVCAGLGAQLLGFAWCFGAWALPLLLAHTALGMLYLNTAFAGNHYDLESFDEDAAAAIPFADLQVRTTRNYAGGALARFVFGGLEHQIEHHLFPAMPRHGLRRAAPRVQAFCVARGLPYRTEPFTRCIDAVLRFHLRREVTPA